METPFPRAVPFYSGDHYTYLFQELPLCMPIHNLEELFLLAFPNYMSEKQKDPVDCEILTRS